MLTFTETKSVCELGYSASQGESYRFADGSTWTIIKHRRNVITGFKAVFMSKADQSKYVLAFAGTDSVSDVLADIGQVLGGVPLQYTQGLMVTQEFRRQVPAGKAFHLAGHSLGGGLAAYCSVSTKIPASTVNPAPLVGAASFSALFRDNSQITNYIAAGGEFVSSSPGRNPGIDVSVQADGNFFTRHSLGNVGPSIAMPSRL
jgi:hypothetical protein